MPGGAWGCFESHALTGVRASDLTRITAGPLMEIEPVVQGMQEAPLAGRFLIGDCWDPSGAGALPGKDAAAGG